MMIGSRTLRVEDDHGASDVTVRVFAPENEGIDSSCRYEIDWPDGLRPRAAYGIDALQALHLALQMIGAEIYTSARHASGRLMWDLPGNGYGFPVPKTIRDLLVGDDNDFEG